MKVAHYTYVLCEDGRGTKLKLHTYLCSADNGCVKHKLDRATHIVHETNK